MGAPGTRAQHPTGVGTGAGPERTLVVWCPDWPVVAAGTTIATGAGAGEAVAVAAAVAVAVVHANRVVACSAVAREEGVQRGLRRREAQRRCPDLTVVAADPARDARAFEPVVAAVEQLTPRVEVVRPGVCAFGTRGPSRYFGGDEALVARTAEVVAAVLPAGATCRVGVADGPFAAGLAARQGRVVAPGGSPAFLAPLPVGALGRPDLTDLLRRLGLRTLGQLAALPAGDVVGRFGEEGRTVHRLASGLDADPLATRRPPPDLEVSMELDPPAERVDVAAFAARALAVELHERLSSRGLACSRVSIEVETEHGEHLTRLWRHEGALSAGTIAERARWQLDGWLNGSAAVRPTSGITVLRLVPDQVIADRGRQLGFWGGVAAATERAARAAARVQGLLGPDAVRVPERRGGRGPAEQVVLLPVDAVELGVPATVAVESTGPWPGRVPPPSPATVHPDPPPAEVVAGDGAPVAVSGRGLVTAEPARLSVAGGQWADVAGWAGPWPVDERWWDPGAHRRRARLQVLTTDGDAHLLAVEGGRWWVEATYD